MSTAGPRGCEGAFLCLPPARAPPRLPCQLMPTTMCPNVRLATQGSRASFIPRSGSESCFQLSARGWVSSPSVSQPSIFICPDTLFVLRISFRSSPPFSGALLIMNKPQSLNTHGFNPTTGTRQPREFAPSLPGINPGSPYSAGKLKVTPMPVLHGPDQAVGACYFSWQYQLSSVCPYVSRKSRSEPS